MDVRADADLVGYSPPLSLWKLVEQHVATHELEEIKSMLGVSVVEETLELHEELHAFLDIWRDCRNVSEQHDRQTKSHRLPEPPGVRDRLIQEIRFFIENVKEKAQEQGRDENRVMRSYNQNVIDYAINGESRAPSCDPSMSRPQSVMGRDGKETPSLRYGSPASDRFSTSTYSTLSEDVEAMADKLNILKLDEVISHLRAHLAEEKDILVQDLRFLQQCIEDENSSTITPEIAEPTIGELREERLKLEKEMLSEVFLHQKPLNTAISPMHMKPSSAKHRTPIVPSNGPMKAVHLTAPDGIVLAGNVPESVIIKAQQKLHEQDNNNKAGPLLVKLETITQESADVPKRPTSASNRPSSARRFRSMVMSARTVSGE